MNSSISNTARNVKSSIEYTQWKEKMARIGHIAKGTVYGIAGILTLLAAFGMGGQNAGKLQVIEFLQKQAFGNILVILMAAGLACYAFFRFIQVTGKTEGLQEQSGKKRAAKKAGYAISGIIYLAFAVYAVVQVTGSSGSGGGNTKQGLLTQLMSNGWGVALVYLAAVLLLAKAVYQFYRVIKKDYVEGVRALSVGQEKAEKIVRNAGAAGFIARGILIGITAWFCFRAASQRDASDIQGSSGAFSFIEQSTSGPWLVAAVAVGLVCYGVYMFIIARYKNFHIQ
jgi:hypothetical protein